MSDWSHPRFSTKLYVPAVFALSLLLGACGGNTRNDVQTFDGQFFRASLDRDGRNSIGFEVSARPVSSSALGAAQAAEYEAITYCINTFGTSEIDWEIGPDSAPESIAVVNDTLTFRGACRF